MKVAPKYTPRFVPQGLLEGLLHCYRMTAVGHVVNAGTFEGDPFTRINRIRRAVAAFEKLHPEVRGAYKDLDGLIGQECGRVNA